MNAPIKAGNRRILVIDDSESIHQDYRKILGAAQTNRAALAAAGAALFGEATDSREVFEVDSAYQGQQGLDMVMRELARNRPYAMAFVDSRMPPGWDGIETIEHLWREDPQLQVALCTAYSDYSWEALAGRLDLGDRLLILKKPFESIEIRQMASALTTKWEMTKQAAFKMSSLEQAVEERTKELSDANIIVQNSPTILYRLRGEPSFPLIYISHNITKFGYDRAALLASPDWAQRLVAPDDLAKLEAAMSRILEKDAQGASIEIRLRTSDGSFRWVDNRYIPIRDKHGRLIEVEGIIIDITERKTAEEKIALLARTDALTGLANRATFFERLSQAFAAARRGALPFSILYLDLDHFKTVNDTLGHFIGDLLLREVALRLRSCTRTSDLVARLGGDEFGVLQGEMGEPANAGALAAKIQTALALPYLLNGNQVRISVSIGICPYVPESCGPDAMLIQADQALYRSKEEGRNRYHFHSDDLDREVLDRVTLGEDLKKAIDHEELELQYQPQVELSSGKIVGIEALVRWNHPTRGFLVPGTFIPIAEKTGTMLALGHWVLDQACRQMSLWRDEGIAPSEIAINLSLFQLKSGKEFVKDVAETLVKWHLAPSDLEFDVTEAMLAQTKWSQNDVLTQLRELGVKIAIDAFGSEYSSFDYVKAHHVNHLKIAQSFINECERDPDSAATIRAIVSFAHDIGVGVIVQGVETEQQRVFLASMDATAQGQGHWFSKALKSERASELLRRGIIGLRPQGDGTGQDDADSIVKRPIGPSKDPV